MDYNEILNMVRQQAYDNNMWSAQMAANNMNFQANMANTAHQREVADLKAAGLNPILSAHTNGAAVTSGAMAQPDTAVTSEISGILQNMMNQQTALSLAAGRGSGGSGGYSGKNTYYGKDPWSRMVQDYLEGLFGGDAEDVLKRAGEQTAKWLRNNDVHNAKDLIVALWGVNKKEDPRWSGDSESGGRDGQNNTGFKGLWTD